MRHLSLSGFLRQAPPSAFRTGRARPGFAMDAYFPALIALSVAGFIETRSSIPALRPSDPGADYAFRMLGRFAFTIWLVLLLWGLWKLPWWQPVSGFVGSLAANALVLQAGPRRSWPVISMVLSVAGLFLAAAVWLLARTP
ncbi:multidrug DMT transporter permease [Sabulicella glaciei]|uniref:Multidrug DMT transporter permease n=1 Tax=Sabulicella glaciei TaxID=2984948 RepID=A0ABT3NYI5_9PROT|nr:multidrug DMT transporter permease [Roseococcus sp. MDT2-1-1]MCW8087229.1 multidrug DMT transporter permease [Roseococcus sp. MDT2-1-1]